MTVYRFGTPSSEGVGPIEDVLAALVTEIEPGNFYSIEGGEDLLGVQLVTRLVELRDQAEPDHTYIEHIAFHRSVGGDPEEYWITRRS